MRVLQRNQSNRHQEWKRSLVDTVYKFCGVLYNACIFFFCFSISGVLNYFGSCATINL